MRLARGSFLALLPFVLAGCHSAYVEATIVNASGSPVSPVEIDYPSASFGTALLAPGQKYTYRFKVQGDGPTKLLWTDAQHQDHTAAGPNLAEHDEGQLTVTLTPKDPAWTLALTNRAAFAH